MLIMCHDTLGVPWTTGGTQKTSFLPRGQRAADAGRIPQPIRPGRVQLPHAADHARQRLVEELAWGLGPAERDACHRFNARVRTLLLNDPFPLSEYPRGPVVRAQPLWHVKSRDFRPIQKELRHVRCKVPYSFAFPGRQGKGKQPKTSSSSSSCGKRQILASEMLSLFLCGTRFFFHGANEYVRSKEGPKYTNGQTLVFFWRIKFLIKSSTPQI